MNATSIHLRIDRLVLEGLPNPPGYSERFVADLQVALTAALTEASTTTATAPPGSPALAAAAAIADTVRPRVAAARSNRRGSGRDDATTRGGRPPDAYPRAGVTGGGPS